jgi:hypothetical protein
VLTKVQGIKSNIFRQIIEVLGVFILFSQPVSAASATQKFTENFDQLMTGENDPWSLHSWNNDETGHYYFTAFPSVNGSYYIETQYDQPLEAGNAANSGIRSREVMLQGDFDVTLNSRSVMISGQGTGKWYGILQLRLSDRADGSYSEGSLIELKHTIGFNPDTESWFEKAQFSHKLDDVEKILDGANCNEGTRYCRKVKGRSGDATTMSIKRVDNTLYAYFNEKLVGSFTVETASDLYIAVTPYIYNVEAGGITNYKVELDSLVVRPLVDTVGDVTADIKNDTIPLKKGWNLISPSVDDGRPLSTLLSENSGIVSRVLAYKPFCNCDGWVGADTAHDFDSLYRLRADHSYWLYSPTGGSFSLRGLQPSSAIVNLQNGWNLLSAGIAISGGSTTTASVLRDRIRSSSNKVKVEQLTACSDNSNSEGSCTWEVEPATTDAGLSLFPHQGLWVKLQAPQQDIVAPSVALSTSVGADNLTQAGEVQLNAIATDAGGIRQVDFYEGGRLLGSDLIAPYSLPVQLNQMDDGAHEYSAQAIDMEGNRRSSIASVVVDIDPPSATGVEAAKQLVKDMRTWNGELNALAESGQQFGKDLDQVEKVNHRLLTVVEDSLFPFIDLAGAYFDLGSTHPSIAGGSSPYSYDLAQLSESPGYTGTGTITVRQNSEAGVRILHFEGRSRLGVGVESEVDLEYSYPINDSVVTAAATEISGSIDAENMHFKLGGARIVGSWSGYQRWADGVDISTQDIRTLALGMDMKLEFDGTGEDIGKIYTADGEVHLVVSNLQPENKLIPVSFRLDGLLGESDGVKSSFERVTASASFSNGDHLDLDSSESDDNYWQVVLSLTTAVNLEGLDGAQLTVDLERTSRTTAAVEATLAYGDKATRLNFSISEPVDGNDAPELGSLGRYNFSNGLANAEMNANHDQVTGTLTVAGELVGEVSEDNVGVGVEYSDGSWEYF